MTAAGWAACLASGTALAAKAPHKCLDEKGHVVYSDLPCPVAAVSIAPPPPPPCALTTEQKRTAERLENQFLVRFPDEERHRALSFAGLGEVVARFRLANGRLSDLRRERKSIDDELMFYERRPVPADLQRRVDANDAKFAAMAEVFLGLETEIKTMMTRYDCERRQFGFLWNKGAPGSSACAEACRAGA
jgi:hypothetical protein